MYTLKGVLFTLKRAPYALKRMLHTKNYSRLIELREAVCCCSVLQCVNAACCSVLQRVAVCCSTCCAYCASTSEAVAGCCSVVLWHVTLSCGVLQYLLHVSSGYSGYSSTARCSPATPLLLRWRYRALLRGHRAFWQNDRALLRYLHRLQGRL